MGDIRIRFDGENPGRRAVKRPMVTEAPVPPENLKNGDIIGSFPGDSTAAMSKVSDDRPVSGPNAVYFGSELVSEKRLDMMADSVSVSVAKLSELAQTMARVLTDLDSGIRSEFASTLLNKLVESGRADIAQTVLQTMSTPVLDGEELETTAYEQTLTRDGNELVYFLQKLSKASSDDVAADIVGQAPTALIDDIEPQPQEGVLDLEVLAKAVADTVLEMNMGRETYLGLLSKSTMSGELANLFQGLAQLDFEQAEMPKIYSTQPIYRAASAFTERMAKAYGEGRIPYSAAALM